MSMPISNDRVSKKQETEHKKSEFNLKTENNSKQEIVSKSSKSLENKFILSGEVLYFKALEDYLNYAEKIPQNATFTPKVHSVSQHFDYEPGFRIEAIYKFNPWELGASFLRYHIHPPTENASDKAFGLLATLATPVWGALGNNQSN